MISDPMDATYPNRWPDGLDATLFGLFLAMSLALPATGYVLMVADYRAYLRSLRRAVVRVVNYLPHLPGWANPYTPRCLVPFGLTLPCTEEQLKRAYRRLVKEMHPDRGGDRRRFLILQRFFEEALNLVRQHADIVKA